jgi:hypothetical protein
MTDDPRTANKSLRAKPTFGWTLPRFGRRVEGWPLGAFEKFCLTKA